MATLAFASVAAAQGTPRPELRITSGWTGFIDESWIDHTAIGGSVRYYLTPRLGIEPEVMYLVGPGSDRDITVIPHLTVDFNPGGAVRPYFIGGAGLLRFQQGVGTGLYTAKTWVVNGGFGVRIPLGSRIFVAPEARIGYETLLRFSGSFGFTF
jgi:hypothetical protein